MFVDREDAAQKLTLKLLKNIKGNNFLVIALPRGGVVIGKIVASYLGVPLDILVLKKIGLPQNPELAVGVIGPKNTVSWNREILKKLRLPQGFLEDLKDQKEIERFTLESILRKIKKEKSIKGKKVILVDDGVATGATVLAARKYILNQGASSLVLAVPVIAKETFNELRKCFDRVIVLKKPSQFFSVGQFYYSFSQIENKEVIELLKE